MRNYNQIAEDIEKKITQKYSEGHSSIKVGNEFGVHFSTVLQIVRRQGLKTRTTAQTSKKYSFNDRFFEKIDNEKKAYWLGFIVADGCISRGKDIIIALKANDQEHLRKFISDIDGNNKYSIQDVHAFGGIYPTARLSIRSKNMCDDLKKCGVGERKSLTATVPTRIPAHLLKHFWRGVVDGDGHICINMGQEKYRYLEMGLCGSKPIISGFISFLKINGLHMKLSMDHAIWRTKTSHKRAIKICSLLYDDAVIYLERKMEVYRHYDETNTHNS